MSDASCPPVVVVGLMGAGKTSVASRLAAALGRQLRDSDRDLNSRYGEDAATQVQRYGAPVLHQREAEHLRQALAQRPAPVIAAAASVVDDPQLRHTLHAAFVVWLDAPPEVLADRMRHGTHRPHYEPDLRLMLQAQRRRRAPWFAEVADLTIDVTDTTPDRSTELVVAALQQVR